MLPSETDDFIVCMVAQNTGFEAWPVVWSNKTLTETFDKGSLVYLTHESPHILHEMDPDKVSSPSEA